MEGDPEDLEDESEAQNRPSSVLWEKCIQQSIFVDISDDDSLHFSDLQGSFTIHLSQDSAASESMHFSENVELSDSDEVDEAATASRECNMEGETEGSIKKASVQRPNGDPADTSDEDQEDLPYDGDVRTQTLNRVTHNGNSEQNSKAANIPEDSTPKLNMGADMLDVLSLPAVSGAVGKMQDNPSREVNSMDAAAVVHHNGDPKGQSSGNNQAKEVVPTPGRPRREAGDITNLLLQHFSQDELLNSSRYIEAETMPEVSLMESIDETVLSRISRSPRQSTGSCSSDSDRIHSRQEEGERSEEGSPTVSERTDSEDAETSVRGEVALSPGSDTASGKDEEPELSSRASNPDLTKENVHVQRFPLGRTRSFSELKYGQGQVHYPLPDFSKVAPKVKIPKTNGTVRPVCQSPAMMRAQSSPGILGKSTASCQATVDVISRVLEDSIRPPEQLYDFPDQENPPGLVHHLQAEYDKLLTKYAEAENLIDQMRLGAQTQASSGPTLSIDWGDTMEAQGVGGNVDQTGRIPRSIHPPQTGFDEDQNNPVVQTNTQSQSEGDRMTNELKDIIIQFLEKVEEFKSCLKTMSISVEEQQMVFKSMMNAQDQLERNYISKKEEHRALEMQNYMGLARNTGEFDPERQVEGEIFRIGMHLEDIKEQIDRNVCSRLSPPTSSCVPTLPLYVGASTSSLQPGLHEELVACFPTSHPKMEQGSLRASGYEVTPEASPLHCTGESSISLQYSDISLERLEVASGGEDESLSVLSDGADYGGSSTWPERPWAPDGLKHPVKPAYELSESPAGGVSCSPYIKTPGSGPPTQDTPEQAPKTAQRIVSPETDSGFGSSDLSRAATGLSQSHPQTERLHLLSDESSPVSMSGSDSDVSCSNVQTTISQVAQNGGQRATLQPSSSALDQWVNSTVQGAPASPQESDSLAAGQLMQQDWHACPVRTSRAQSVSAGNPQRSEAPPHVCSCHNEAIVALQCEVSRLKRDLEESLFHLPHLTKRMDYLAAKYKQERRHKPRPRTHHKHTSSRHPNTNTSLQKIEDWISSDMEPSKSKGTDSADSDRTVSMQELLRSPHGASKESCSLETSTHGRGSLGLHAYNGMSYRSPAAGHTENIYSRSRHLPFSTQPLHKPLLQVNYGSCSSLPAGFKVMEKQSQSTPNHRRHSTQSDSALLPSNVYFQRALPPPCSPSRAGGGAGKYRTSKDEDINRTLDKAIEAAMSMKRTTDRMAKSLSADLAKAELTRKLHGLYPLDSRANAKS